MMNNVMLLDNTRKIEKLLHNNTGKVRSFSMTYVK